MKISSILCVSALSLGLSVLAPVALADRGASPGERLADEIVGDIIDRTADAARDEVRRQIGIDPLERGYGDHERSHRAPSRLSDETRRELYALDEEHDRKISQLERELEQKLNKAEAEFRREAAREDKPEKIAEKRDKLREKVDKAHDKFEEKVREENDRFDRKRNNLLSKHD
ncbi:hypothetical protein [Marinobacter profundi]|uniref:Uncharacterized protein n=1 Tax=Marinobacter profundi TaxID=2666256 RepID=A0A2G1UMH8_9GAMM|nr:hypothetical protein [Marinobacter profundi]PHQ15639.1 hypothetical protein CLH61_05635 [Marinobacter profundi]